MSIEEAARYLLDRFAELDTNDDDWLTRDEAAVDSDRFPDRWFERLDIDNDRVLARYELRLAERVPVLACGCRGFGPFGGRQSMGDLLVVLAAGLFLHFRRRKQREKEGGAVQ